MGIIKAARVVYDYLRYGEEDDKPEVNRAIDRVDLNVQAGQFIAVLGHNGSGKSTLAKHINGLLVPTEGTIWFDKMDTSDEDNVWKIRQEAGMVFQNPDNQIIGTVVEEDVGFGPENLGVPTDEIWTRVEESLAAVNMGMYRHHSPNKLSGGQKQRVAIAGVMAMHPKCIVLDEPTAMLDPHGRIEVLRAVKELNRKQGVTVILITHYMEEVVHADKVFVMDDGHMVLEGTPREIFSQVELLKQYRLDVPQVTLLAHALRQGGIGISEGILTREELVESLLSEDLKVDRAILSEKQEEGKKIKDVVVRDQLADVPKGKELLRLDHVSYVYSPGTAYEIAALKDVSLTIPQGQFIAMIGHTGSGKSTLIQHLNGLIRPTEGVITYEGEDIWGEHYSRKELRHQVGLVFQYPEHQLFETDVLTDVCFGPKNQGLSQEECGKRAHWALNLVGLGDRYDQKSPFELSGGQKRRVAIAGVLAMNPKVLILDEPTAGLDPRGRDEILDQISLLHRESGITIILVSHSMEDVARYADRLIVMNHGEKVFDDTPKNVFSHYRRLEEMDLAAPQITYVVHELKEKGLAVDTNATTVEEACDTIWQAFEKRGSL